MDDRLTMKLNLQINSIVQYLTVHVPQTSIVYLLGGSYRLRVSHSWSRTLDPPHHPWAWGANAGSPKCFPSPHLVPQQPTPLPSATATSHIRLNPNGELLPYLIYYYGKILKNACFSGKGWQSLHIINIMRIRKMLIYCVKLDHALYSINYGTCILHCKATFYACEKFMWTCQNRPLDKFIYMRSIVLYA